jgi:hypothetical protein
VTSIEDFAFYSCRNLARVTIPGSVKSMGNWSFGECPKVTIYGYANTYAQSFAASKNIPFVVLGA